MIVHKLGFMDTPYTISVDEEIEMIYQVDMSYRKRDGDSSLCFVKIVAVPWLHCVIRQVHIGFTAEYFLSDKP